MNGWLHHIEGPGARHVWPVDDLREHDLGDPADGAACWCLPEWSMMATNDGAVTMFVRHKSLDGRERRELLAESWRGRLRLRFDTFRNRRLQ